MTMLSYDDVQRLAGSVVNRLAPGLQIRTASSHFESGPPKAGALDIAASIELKVSYKRGSKEDADRTSLVAISRYRLEATPHGAGEGVSAADRTGWKCEVELHGQWSVDTSEDLEDNALRAFAARVGLMALHPYARSHIQSAVSEAAWPPFTLDVLTPATGLFESPTEPGMWDLDGIEVVE